LPAVQSAVVLHIFGQPLAPQTLGVQSCAIGVTHMPLPSQVLTAVYLLDEHMPAAHWVPLAHLRHWPLPSQLPS